MCQGTCSHKGIQDASLSENNQKRLVGRKKFKNTLLTLLLAGTCLMEFHSI